MKAKGPTGGGDRLARAALDRRYWREQFIRKRARAAGESAWYAGEVRDLWVANKRRTPLGMALTPPKQNERLEVWWCFHASLSLTGEPLLTKDSTNAIPGLFGKFWEVQNPCYPVAMPLAGLAFRDTKGLEESINRSDSSAARVIPTRGPATAGPRLARKLAKSG